MNNFWVSSATNDAIEILNECYYQVKFVDPEAKRILGNAIRWLATSEYSN